MKFSNFVQQSHFLIIRMFFCYTKRKHCRKGGRILPLGKGEVGMETYEFLTFLVVFTVLIISVKR